MRIYIGLLLFLLSFWALAQTPPCTIYKRIPLGATKVGVLDAVGEPYVQNFKIKKDGDKTQYIFELDKKYFIELYLDFDEQGKLIHKTIAGPECD